MEVATIVIQSLEDAAKGENGLFSRPVDPKLCQYVPMRIQILERGMTSGKTSLAFGIEGGDGKFYIAQMTPDQMEMLIAVFRGARERFEGSNYAQGRSNS